MERLKSPTAPSRWVAHLAAASLSDPGRIDHTGGTVNLIGVVTGDFTLTDTLGDVALKGGTLKNGTFQNTSSNSKLIATSTPSFLDNVTLASPIDLSTNGAASRRIEWPDHQHEPGDWYERVYRQCVFPLPRRSDGTDRRWWRICIYAVSRQLFWPGQLIGRSRLCSDHCAGGHRSRSLRESGHDFRSIDQSGHHSREGTLSQTFSVQMGNNSRNEGTIEGTGSWLRVYGSSNSSWTNLGTISMDGGGTLQLGLQTSEIWSNLGTVSVTGSTLNISGGGAAVGKPMTQASLGIIDRDAASTIKLATNFTLTGDLNLDDNTGSWQLAGAALQDGTINTSGSAAFRCGGGWRRVLPDQ